MKKVILIGELNQTVSTINNYLQTKFQTQLCMDSLEMVKGMVKVFEPEMAVICLVGVGELDHKILDFFENRRNNVPVLLIGTTEECGYFKKYYDNEQFDFLTRPTTLSELMEKCQASLKVEEDMSESIKSVEKAEAKKRILVVDDSGVLLRSVKAMLADQYEVIVAMDGKKALERARNKQPDLILLDYEMPVMDGRETLEELRKDDELKESPVVFLTSVADRESIASVLKLKPEGYLLKPIEQARMLETIESVLEAGK